MDGGRGAGSSTNTFLAGLRNAFTLPIPATPSGRGSVAGSGGNVAENRTESSSPSFVIDAEEDDDTPREDVYHISGRIGGGEGGRDDQGGWRLFIKEDVSDWLSFICHRIVPITYFACA